MNNTEINFKDINHEIFNKGYFICKNLIDFETYKESRIESINFFKEISKNISSLQSALRGHVGAGMKDVLGYENNNYWKIIRGCYFPWNKIENNLKNTIYLSRKLSTIRNKICGFSPDKGSVIEKNGYVQYTSLSLYGSDGGFLNKHRDGHDKKNDNSFIHFKLELTHKNKDYKKGGFYIWDNNNQEIDISSKVNPTDVVFFNGSNFHEIKSIEGGIGRIALFEIPTYVSEQSRIHNYTKGSKSFLEKSKNKGSKLWNYLLKKKSNT